MIRRVEAGFRAELIAIYVVGFFLLAVVLFFQGFRGIFVEEADVRRALEDEGYVDIVVADRHNVFVAWRSCSASDAAQFNVDATRDGRRVRLYVCAGWPAKAVTIRH